MAKFKLSVLIIILFALTACKKDKPTLVTQKPDNNSWILDTDENMVLTTSRLDAAVDNKVLVFKSAKTAEFQASFKSFPTKSGIYQLVDIGGEPLLDNQCRITGITTNHDPFYLYYDRIGTRPTLTLTVNESGKISLNIPEIKVTFPQPAPVVSFKASLTEK
jgi:hypothetical protein